MSKPATLPEANDSEKALLSCALMAGHWQEALDDMLAAVPPDWLFVPVHREIWSEFDRMTQDGIPVAAQHLLARLRESGKLDECGGASFVAELATADVMPQQWRHHAAPVERAAKARRLMMLAVELQEAATDPAKDMDAACETAIQALADQQSGRNSEPVTAQQWMADTIISIQREVENPQGWESGIQGVGEVFGRFLPETLITIGARPGVGKTAILMRILEDLCMEQKLPGLLFSLEMSRDQIGRRQTAMTGRFPLQYVKNRRPGQEFPQWVFDAAGHAAARWSEAPIFVDDRSGLSIAQICNRIRQQVRKRGVKIVGIDYLQMIGGTRAKSADDKRARIEECTKALAVLKKQTGVCIILLCQANRDSVGAAPQMHHLEGAASIEQDSDAVLFIHRHSELKWHEVAESVRKGFLRKFNDDESRAINAFEKYAELVVRKNRHGPGTGSVPLQWIGDQTRFDAWAA